MFKELAGLGSLLKNAQQISGRMQGLAEELRQKRATGSAGGGMVEVTVNGAAAMKELTGGVSLPGMDEALAKFMAPQAGPEDEE